MDRGHRLLNSEPRGGRDPASSPLVEDCDGQACFLDLVVCHADVGVLDAEVVPAAGAACAELGLHACDEGLALRIPGVSGLRRDLPDHGPLVPDTRRITRDTKGPLLVDCLMGGTG